MSPRLLLLAGLTLGLGNAVAQPLKAPPPRDLEPAASNLPVLPLAIADAAAAGTQLAAAGQVDGAQIAFGADLFVASDIMLQGITAWDVVTFTRPQRWELNRAPVLHLRYEYSAALDPARSSITVRVNDKAIASQKIVQAKGDKLYIELLAPIPEEMLADYNTLTMSVVQHVTDECEDPFDPSLWTRVRSDSYIDFGFREKVIPAELKSFPYPFLDPLGYGPLELSLGGPQGVSAGQLQALGILGVAFGRHAAYRHVQVAAPVTDLTQAREHVLLVGTPQENPLIARVVNTQALTPGQGLIAAMPNPSNPTLGVLVVTGADEAGLLKAAGALAGQSRHEVLSGRESTVGLVEESRPPATRQSPLPVPPAREFTLADLAIADQTVRGFYAPAIKIPLKMEGDSHARIDGARVGIDFAYSAMLETKLSTMEVKLNGVTLASVSLSDPAGKQKNQGFLGGPRLWVDLPFELVEPTSELEVIFHLFPNNYEPCVYTTDVHIWGTVYASTVVEMGRDHWAMLPDLSLLRHDLWPLSTAVGDGGISIITADQPNIHDAGGALQMAAEIGRVSVVDAPELKVSAGAVSKDGSGADDTLVLLVGDGAHSTHASLVRDRQIALPGDLDRALQAQSKDLLTAKVGAAYATIEQALNPTNPDKTILVLHAPSASALRDLAADLQDFGRLVRMEGKAAVFGGDNSVESIKIDEKSRRQVGVIPLSSSFQTFVRASWPLLVLGVILASVVLSVLVRAWADRRGGQA